MFQENPEQELIKFNRERFLDLMEMFFYFISHEENLTHALKKLLDFEKYQSGIFNLETTMSRPTILSINELYDIIDVLRLKPINVEQLLNDHKTIKFHKISSWKQLERMKKGELKSNNEFEESIAFKNKIQRMTDKLSRDIEKSLIRKKSFAKLGNSPQQKKESEEFFHKIPSRFSIANASKSKKQVVLINQNNQKQWREKIYI
jgi:hypothetical protein